MTRRDFSNISPSEILSILNVGNALDCSLMCEQIGERDWYGYARRWLLKRQIRPMMGRKCALFAFQMAGRHDVEDVEMYEHIVRTDRSLVLVDEALSALTLCGVRERTELLRRIAANSNRTPEMIARIREAIRCLNLGVGLYEDDGLVDEHGVWPLTQARQ